MFKFNVIGAVVGSIMMFAFLGFLGWWLKSWPLSIIIIFVLGLMVFDIARELRKVRASGDRA